MIRKIVNIDSEKCNGCGACAAACHEGAIQMRDGKAELIKDDYCDGLGDCLPECPTGAITIIEREASDFDKEAVAARMAERTPHACPGSMAKTISGASHSVQEAPQASVSRLMQWPVQIKLVPTNAPYFEGANLLVAADCTAYAYAGFHEKFMRNHVTLVGCPKLDSVDYSEKLTEIIKNNNIKSLTVVRMEVPCCGGLEYAAVTALKQSGKFIPWRVVTISVNGEILND